MKLPTVPHKQSSLRIEPDRPKRTGFLFQSLLANSPKALFQVLFSRGLDSPLRINRFPTRKDPVFCRWHHATHGWALQGLTNSSKAGLRPRDAWVGLAPKTHQLVSFSAIIFGCCPRAQGEMEMCPIGHKFPLVLPSRAGGNVWGGNLQIHLSF